MSIGNEVIGNEAMEVAGTCTRVAAGLDIAVQSAGGVAWLSLTESGKENLESLESLSEEP